MKWITAIIPPERLEATKEELEKVQVSRMTVSDVQGLSDGPGLPSEASAAQRYGAAAPSHRRSEPRVKLMIAVQEATVEPAISAIRRGVGDGNGRIFILPLEEVIRVRTGERGPEAI